jgi:hypothetical protein
MAKRGGIGVDEDEAEEDDEDEYRAPYLARQMLRVETRTPGGVRTPRFLASGRG